MAIKVNEDGSFTLVIDGKDLTLSAEDMEKQVARLQKDKTADKRLQEATEKLKEADARVAALFKRIDQGDRAAYEEVLGLMGVTDREKQARLAQFDTVQKSTKKKASAEPEEEDDDSDDDDDGPKPTRGDVGSRALEAKLSKLTEQLEALQSSVGTLRGDHHDRMRGQIRGEIRSALESGEKTAKLMKDKTRADALVDSAFRFATVRAHDGDKWGPSMLQSVVKDLTMVIDGLSPEAGEPTPTGLGPAPAIAAVLKTAGDKPVKLGRIGDPDYTEKLMGRLVQAGADADARGESADIVE